MPQLLRIGPYTFYFWSNESVPLEPVHIHIVEGRPTPDATKVWITATGRALLCHNKSKIPERVLNRLLRVVEANAGEFVQAWREHFGNARFFC